MAQQTNEEKDGLVLGVDHQKNYFNSKVEYYRTIIRRNNDSYLKKLQKIPDDWDSNTQTGIDTLIAIPSEQKKRLSEIKKAKVEEYKFEVLYIDHLVLIENTVISCLNYSQLSPEQLAEAKNSLALIIENFNARQNQFKLLLLNTAKKATSDLYYLALSYVTFFKKKPFRFEEDFITTCKDMLQLIHNYETLTSNLDVINKYNSIIHGFFYKTQDKIGLRMEDHLLKDYYEKQEGDKVISAVILHKIVDKIINFKTMIKTNFEFLKFYYGDQAGKLYRYNFIINTLTQKFEEKKIDYDTLEGFKKIEKNFMLLKQHFEQQGLLRFGPDNCWYYDIVQFLYKCCKILEFIYLRTSRYEQLQDLRSDIVHTIENEIVYFNKIK